MFLHFNVLDLGMNFIPREITWSVAKFGLNIFERLCIPVGITWFSKMFIGATSGEYGSIVPPDLKEGLLEFWFSKCLKNCFCWRKLGGEKLEFGWPLNFLLDTKSCLLFFPQCHIVSAFYHRMALRRRPIYHDSWRYRILFHIAVLEHCKSQHRIQISLCLQLYGMLSLTPWLWASSHSGDT